MTAAQSSNNISLLKYSQSKINIVNYFLSLYQDGTRIYYSHDKFESVI